MEIHERILYFRKDVLKISRREFGEKLGVSESEIVNIEHNRLQRPEQKKPLYKLICKEYGIRYEWLTEGVEPISEDSMAPIDDIMNGQNEFAKNLFREFAKLDDSEWKTLEKLIKNISKNME